MYHRLKNKIKEANENSEKIFTVDNFQFTLYKTL